jgi:hypothetical protein
MTPEPDLYIPPGIDAGPVDVLILVPYVDGMLRPETMAAIHESGHAYLTQPIDPADPYEYAGWFRNWWRMPMDLIVIEQDMVPTPAQINELAYHPDPWVGARYHVGNGQYTTGLGFCALGAKMRQSHPDAGVNITVDQRGNGNLVDWISLNENVERHLTRLGETMTVIDTPVTHLHYPVAAHA